MLFEVPKSAKFFSAEELVLRIVSSETKVRYIGMYVSIPS